MRKYGRETDLKGTIATTFVIIVLSLGIWLFFYLASMPLDASSTMVVVGICIALVYAGKFIWSRMCRRKGKRVEKA